MLLALLFEPMMALPAVVCDPPKPAAHTLQRCSKVGAGSALVDIAAYASRSPSVRPRDAWAELSSANALGAPLALTGSLRPETNGSVIRPMNWFIALNVVC
jgi:hypothetical protein